VVFVADLPAVVLLELNIFSVLNGYKVLIYLTVPCIPLRDHRVALHVYVKLVSPSTNLSLVRGGGGWIV